MPTNVDSPSSLQTPAQSIAQLREVARTVSLQDMYEFILRRYKRERFEGRNGPSYGADYSAVVAKSSLENLRAHGFALISHFESLTGESVHYDAHLREISLDTWRELVSAELSADRIARATEKMNAMLRGETVVVSEEQLDSLIDHPAMEYVTSVPNPKRVGTLDRYTACIPKRFRSDAAKATA